MESLQKSNVSQNRGGVRKFAVVSTKEPDEVIIRVTEEGRQHPAEPHFQLTDRALFMQREMC